MHEITMHYENGLLASYWFCNPYKCEIFFKFSTRIQNKFKGEQYFKFCLFSIYFSDNFQNYVSSPSSCVYEQAAKAVIQREFSNVHTYQARLSETI